MAEPCSGGPLAAIFHTHDEWTGMCGCGAGPFVKAEWRRHYLAATSSVGETVCDLDAERDQPAPMTTHPRGCGDGEVGS